LKIRRIACIQWGFMSTAIAPERFREENAVVWAPWLLGKVLVRTRTDGVTSRHIITETEAYNGQEDLACHASKGRTPRTDVLFREGGIWYVYLCYGIHEMLNLVVGPDGFPAAVLIRALHDVSGPGRVTKHLNIGRPLNGKPAAVASGLFIEDTGVAVPVKWVQTTRRIGVDYSGPIWAARRWRFFIDPEWPGLPPVARPTRLRSQRSR
jgi:DNA-3-methyladenine glycosylase